MQVAYVDASALVKLVVDEPERTALRAELVTWPALATSVVAEVEVRRAVARVAAHAVPVAEAVLERFERLPLDDGVRSAAATDAPATLRSLDAVHLASALALGDRLGAFVTYDERLADAARAAGLRVLAPVG